MVKKIMKTNKKYSLAVIILLLITFIPLTLFGYIYRKNNKVEENPNHDLYFNNKLWFYDRDGNLINNYNCQNSSCSLAKSNMNKDKEYNINYYKEGTEENISIINNKYAFIQDGDLINLYDIKANKVIQNYFSVNNYNTTLSDNIFILQDKNKMFGVLYLDDIVNLVIPFEYDYIGLKNDIDENNNLIVNNFIAQKNNKWFLISNINEKLTSDFETIITDYSDKYIISNTDTISIYDYYSNKFVINNRIDKYIFEGVFTGIICDKKLYIYLNLNDNFVKQVDISNGENVSLKYLDNILYIYENNKKSKIFNPFIKFNLS